jgi:hypothetical protein
MAEGQCNLVEPLPQHPLLERIDCEGNRRPVRRDHSLCRQINDHLGPGQVTKLPSQSVDIVRLQYDWEEPVVDTILAEHIAETGRYHGLNPIGLQRPLGRLIKRKSADALPVGTEAAIVKQEITISRPASLLQKTRRNDPIGIDIRHVKRHCTPLQDADSCHPKPPATV